MTPKKEATSPAAGSISVLEHCNTFADALVALIKRRQASNNEKLEYILECIPITVRNWHEIVSGNSVPKLSTFYSFRRALCVSADYDKFDAMYITATLNKKRFSENDIVELIEFNTGVRCTRKDTEDPKCFRAIAFSSKTILDGNEACEKAIAFFQAMRSLLAAKRLPARSENDRQLRIALMMYREALASRVMNKIAKQAELINAIDRLDIKEHSAFIKGSIVDLRLLSTNAPEEVFFIDLERPAVDAHVSGFKEVLRYFECYDGDAGDPLRDYGFVDTADDARVNLLRLAALYGKDEASRVLKQLAPIKARDISRGASRFLTIYNDLVEIESLISLERTGAAREKIDQVECEAHQMGRSDLEGELLVLRSKAMIKAPKQTKLTMDNGIEELSGAMRYFAQTGNDVKTASIQRLLMQIVGIRQQLFGA